ncbi:MAG: hypothetical protein IAF38_13295 [Bacteroidia bacterium]|nr:hypothetical protein [Bacteroidia bacterium]
MQIATENKIKPGGLYYVVAIYSIFAGFRLLFNEVWNAFEQQGTGYGYSIYLIYYKTLAWYGLLIMLLLISGGILAFKKPKISWFLLIAGSFGIYFQIFFALIDIIPLIFNPVIPGAIGIWFFSSNFFNFVLTLQFIPISIYLFCSSTGKQISILPKILTVCITLTIVLILFFLNPRPIFM